MMYVFIVLGYICIGLISTIMTVRATNTLRNKNMQLRTSLAQAQLTAAEIREEYHHFQLRQMQVANNRAMFGMQGIDRNEPNNVPEITAKELLLRFYHIAKTDQKGTGLRAAVLNWNRKHYKPKNEGQS